MVKINELNGDMKHVEVEGTITKKGDIRVLDTGRFAEKPLSVCTCELSDEESSCELTLWKSKKQDDISPFSEGDRVKIKNGYTRSSKDGSQFSLTNGIYGTIEKVQEVVEEKVE